MKTLTQTEAEHITNGQKKLITRIINDIADSDPVQEALDALSKKGAECLKGNAEFAEALREFAVQTIAEFGVVNEYADEEVRSGYGYLSGYKKPEKIAYQIKIIHELFPQTTWEYFRPDEEQIKSPDLAEGLFAIPNWIKRPEIFGPTYSAAVQKILDTLKKARDGAFHNYHEGAIDEKHLRQSVKSVEFWKNLAEAQGNTDILLVPAQFGIRHRGRSVRRARVIIDDTAGECGLGAFAAGSMLLTHPNRLEHYDDLWIDLSGDEFSPDADGQFSESPFFKFLGDRLKFAAGPVDYAYESFGSASGFVPQ